MNTSLFSCFVFPVFFYVSFFYLYLHLYAFFILVFCFFTTCSLFLLKLRFLSQKASIFIPKLHEYRFVFLLCLSKLKIFVFLSLLRCASPAIFDFYLQTPRIQVHFLASFSLPVFFYVFFFYLYLHLYAFFYFSILFFIACSLFLLKLRFLSQKASIFISKLHVHS
ncbi:hypothetical protein AAZX31_18G086300 [Glycine max]